MKKCQMASPILERKQREIRGIGWR